METFIELLKISGYYVSYLGSIVLLAATFFSVWSVGLLKIDNVDNWLVARGKKKPMKDGLGMALLLLSGVLMFVMFIMTIGTIEGEMNVLFNSIFGTHINSPAENRRESEMELHPVSKMEQKVIDLKDLDEKLKAKKKELPAVKKDYEKEIRRLKEEILAESQKIGANNYQEALRSKRISSDISLIQRQLAYIDKLSEMEFKLDIGSEEILYLVREAEADMQIEKVLTNQNELAGKIDQAIKDYQPYAGNYVFDKENLNLKSAEEIYKDIISGRL